MFYISECKNFLSSVRYQPNVLVMVSQSENWHVALWSFVGIDRFTPSKIELNIVGFSISPYFVKVFFSLSLTICQLKSSLLEKWKLFTTWLLGSKLPQILSASQGIL